MKAIFLSFFLPFTALATAPGPGITPVEIDKLTENEKKRCERHINIYQKNSIKSDCRANYPDLGKYSDDLTKAFNASFTACREAAKFEKDSADKYRSLIADGTKRADAIASQIQGQNGQQQLLASATDASKVQMESFRERNVEIQQTFAKYRSVHDLLARIERYYDTMLTRIGSGNSDSGGLCPSGERNWFRTETSNLEREITAFRKVVAENVQGLNKLYQQNLVAAGASKDQAVQIARAKLLTESAGSMDPALQGVRDEFRARGAELGIKEADIRTTDIRGSGTIKGAEAAWHERLFGTATVHDKEWAKVNCPDGAETTACYDRMYRARASKVDDATLAMFTGDQRLTGSTPPVPPVPAVDPAPGALAITPGSLLGSPPSSPGTVDTNLTRFDRTVSSIPTHAITDGERATVTIDGKEYRNVHTYTNKEDPAGSRFAYVPDGAGNFRIVSNGDGNVSFSDPAGAAPAVVSGASQEPSLAAPRALAGHGRAGAVSSDGVTDFHTKAGGIRFVQKDGQQVDDGFSDLYLNSRNATYFNTQGYEPTYTGQVAKSEDVRTLQRNINILFASSNLSQRVSADGQYGAQTQSALDFIGKNPEMRARLLQMQNNRAPAGR
jgi:hypothetical protein